MFTTTGSRVVRNHLPRRRLLAAAVGLFTAAAFASASCASPRLPNGGVPLRAYAGGYELQVLIDGVPAAAYEHAGETYVLGQLGARYTLRVVNHTGRRIEAVLSVDGRDAIDGKPADFRNKRGYLVPAWGSVDVDGWRLSRAEVAAFRFSTVPDSYAARTGSAREVGVVGVAVFPERIVRPRPVYVTPPYYYNYQPPRWPGGGYGDLKKSAPSADASSGAAEGSGRSRSAAPMADEPPAPASPAPSSRMDGLAEREANRAARRPGLGTEFGEAVNSPVQQVAFVRASASSPSVLLGARYNDRDGLLALGIDLDHCCADFADDDIALRQSATPFPVIDRGYSRPPVGWQKGCCVGY